MAYVKDEGERQMVSELIRRYEENVVPLHHQLRSQVIHNDMNEANVISDGEHITGVIDFGDVTFSHMTSEVAIAMYYMGYDSEDFLYWSGLVLKEFHKVTPLTDDELKTLFFKVGMRSCQCRVNGAVALHSSPDNEYLLWKDEHHRRTLKTLFSLDPAEAEKYMRGVIENE